MMDFASGLAPEYEMFLRPNTDRAAFIQTYLGARGVDCAVIGVDGKRHIYVKLPRQGYDATFRVKTIIAHYDIVPDSPGANDNSSSVFCLMDFAARLAHFRGVHNCRIFLTDGEELGSGGVVEQGAYSLASTMQKCGIRDEDIYVFDCVGRGTVPLLGLNVPPAKAPATFVKKFNALEQGTKALLSSLGLSWVNLPMPYSDNAGFLANGFPAIAITMLPQDEATAYMMALRNDPD
ncbi:MAG: M28 family peptidase, partial [Treponema sp.]|nr:M28 family peptidase [Treponema sp.]